MELVKQQLIGEFSDIRSTNAEELIYVKEDLIIPHVCTSVISVQIFISYAYVNIYILYNIFIIDIYL